ncbi:hypothetical protein N7478_006505 [Penicillium angulare]|uniref:uncharacterized protein n=1 Tax=Penicillium angulare TaxID=116970 RepID=UPI0025415F4E|nr:uncharacterized protein N7478_006505 [Penicillium angulare]KAJ5281133.1 hypothetical protein N7478_006505 [Penicillium angulare]
MAPSVLASGVELPTTNISIKSTTGIATTQKKPETALRNLSQLLIWASTTNGSLSFYSTEGPSSTPISLSYADLFVEADKKASIIRRIEGLTPQSILLLHFDTQYENIIWFWGATLAGYLPAISTPFAEDTNRRRTHLLHLHTLLEQPVVLTAKRLIPEFLGLDELNLHDVESLSAPTEEDVSIDFTGLEKKAKDLAVLMLTSGSTGNAKAVSLRQGQMLKSIRGKSIHHGTEPGDVFLNWVGLDHVASLTETHLHAMSLGSNQVHVSAPEVLRDPLQFLRLIDIHKVVYTFAPNFFLTKVYDSLKANPDFKADLSSLKALISGGESNVVVTCDALTQELRRLGVQGEVIRPGFGMTETCAGSIYSRACPSYDLALAHEFASLGSCVPGINMRVMSVTEAGTPAATGESGELQVSGPILFEQYYNNPKATMEAFTSDGWFITGDLAKIDDAGNLDLVGRIKDTIIINGVKWSATELETALEEEGIAGLVPSYTVAFPTRATGSPTEDIAIVYSPTYSHEDSQARFDTAQAISKTVSLTTGRKPTHVIPLPQSMLEKSSLGKISHTKVRNALESGEYASIEHEDQALRMSCRQSSWRIAESETEKIVQKTVAELLEISADEISMDDSIFDLGVSSLNLIRLRAMVQEAVGAEMQLPMSIMLTEPSPAAISAAIDSLMSKPREYNGIVPLNAHKGKDGGIPLFCIHPGSGDILVFIALAAHFSTRPVYAIRTRGYNPNERFFYSIEETANTYAEQIRQTQPEGPYAIAGYSLGSTLAYEVGKVLEAQGQEVRFLASIDYPPHIAHYVHKLNWIDVLLHIAFFLEIIDEETMIEVTPYLHTLDREAALAHLLEIGDSERAKALAVDMKHLGLVSDIAENFRVNVQTYEPIGKVQNLDVFVADPPRYAAKDRQDWRENKLGRWADFSETPAEFYDCPGIHAKMLNPAHMADFAKIFKGAMRRRGV